MLVEGRGREKEKLTKGGKTEKKGGKTEKKAEESGRQCTLTFGCALDDVERRDREESA